MMKKEYTKLIVLLFTLSLLLACSKNTITPDPDPDPDPDPTGMAALVVNDNFEWSSGLKGTLNLSFENPNNVSIEREIISIVDENGLVLKRAMILNGAASFKIDLPQNATYSIYFPVTGDEFPITSLGAQTLTLTNTISDIPGLKDDEIQSCTTCDNPLINAGAEVPSIGTGPRWTLKHEDDVPGWETTATDNNIEIWTNNFLGVPAQEGNQIFEINATQDAALYQELCVEPGSTVKWSVWHRGRQGVDVAVAKIGATVETAEVQATMTDGNTEWGYYEGTYTVPEGQTTTVFAFEAVSTATGNKSVGNLLDNFEIECDADGDGIKDEDDDDPNNAQVAYVSYFPTAGKQIVAFEDLWPSTGDFDFNDLTMSNKVKINKDQNFNLLSAEFTVSIDAIGATINNGVGLMLYDENKEAFAQNIIESVSGDVSLDNDNTNGLIVTNDVFAAIGDLYKNNGVGPSQVPDTLKFTVNFNANAEDFIPELYLFRTANRRHEIHRAEFPATSMMDNSKFNTSDDAGHYKTANGLPWGIEIYLEGAYASPRELVDMLEAYPQFSSWVSSGGSQNTNWYENPVTANVFVVPTPQ